MIAPKTQEKMRAVIDSMRLTCRWCGARLTGSGLASYDHDDGLALEGHDQPQWVYVKCSGCGHEWSWWKLLNQRTRRTYKEVSDVDSARESG